MKRLLVLTPRFPFPPIGGDRLRIFQICKNLAAEVELSLLSMCESEEEMNCSLPPDSPFSRVERVFHNRLQKFAGCISVLPSRTPLQIGYYRNREFACKLQAMLPSHDGVFAHLIRTGAYLAGCEKPKFLEMTDAISLTYRRAETVAAGNFARRLLYRTESARLLPYEAEILTDFDLSILVSAVDRDVLLYDRVDSRVLVCPNGVDTDVFRFNYSPDQKTILFIGNNRARHNSDAVLYFANEIFPRIRDRLKEAQFRVVGPISESLLRKLQQIPGIVATGVVDNIADASKHASVGICPTRFGAGVQNKILEYMSAGIPTVTSSIGLEGLEATDGVHLSVARDEQEWVNKVCDLLCNPALGLRMATAARTLVEEKYSWASMLSPLRRRICELLEAQPQNSSPD